MDKPLLVLFLGVPGSGKTTFARQLAQRLNGVILSSDGIRMAMWKSREAIEESRKTDEERLYANQLVFGAMQYAARQAMKAGHVAILDSIATYRHEREHEYGIAKECGANAVLVQIETPREVMIQRVQEREPAEDQRRFHEEKAIGVINHFTEVIELPTDDEPVITIDGQAPFEQQYERFMAEYARLYS